MLVEVHFTGDSFIAFGPDGKRITNRAILDQISFDQFPGFKTFYHVKVNANVPAEPVQLDIQTNIAVKK